MTKPDLFIVKIDPTNPLVFKWAWGDQHNYRIKSAHDIRPEVFEWCDARAPGQWGENYAWTTGEFKQKNYWHEFVFLSKRMAQLFQLRFGDFNLPAPLPTPEIDRREWRARPAGTLD